MVRGPDVGGDLKSLDLNSVNWICHWWPFAKAISRAPHLGALACTAFSQANPCDIHIVLCVPVWSDFGRSGVWLGFLSRAPGPVPAHLGAAAVATVPYCRPSTGEGLSLRLPSDPHSSVEEVCSLSWHLKTSSLETGNCLPKQVAGEGQTQAVWHLHGHENSCFPSLPSMDMVPGVQEEWAKNKHETLGVLRRI